MNYRMKVSVSNGVELVSNMHNHVNKLITKIVYTYFHNLIYLIT